jgi:hypothetical protein
MNGNQLLFQLLNISFDLLPHMTVERQFHLAQRTNDLSAFGQNFQRIFAFAPAKRTRDSQLFIHNESPDI